MAKWVKIEVNWVNIEVEVVLNYIQVIQAMLKEVNLYNFIPPIRVIQVAMGPQELLLLP